MRHFRSRESAIHDHESRRTWNYTGEDEQQFTRPTDPGVSLHTPNFFAFYAVRVGVKEKWTINPTKNFFSNAGLVILTGSHNGYKYLS